MSRLPRVVSTHSLRLRLVGGAIICIGLALGAVGVVLSSLFADHTYRVVQDQLRHELDAMTAALDWSDDGRLVMTRHLADPRFEKAYSGRYWQVVADGQATLASRSLWDVLLVLSPEAGQAAPPGDTTDVSRLVAGPGSEPLVALGRTIRLEERDVPITLLVTAPQKDWREQTANFDRLLATALLVTGVALLLASLAQVAYGLLPLRRLGNAVALLRADRRHRLAGTWPLEVRPLVDEIEALLDSDVAMLDRARRQAGDLAHAIKTPLSVLANEAQMRPQDPFASEVAVHAETIRQQLERQLARARAAGRAVEGVPGRIDVIGVAEGLVRAMNTLYQDRRLDIRCHGEGQFSGDAQDLAEMLGNLLDNACKWADACVVLAARREDRFVRVAIEDDGPGIRDGQDSPRPEGPLPLDEDRHGSGLGLSIVEDIAALYGGSVRYDKSTLGGLRVELRLPA